MSTLLEPVVDFNATESLSIDKEFKPKLFNNRRLKSKENILKLKFHKELKKKLKKYKLRRDGQEDPEVLDVSQILVSSLKIKSPNNNICTNDTEEELRPKNYLFKMGRKKQVIKKNAETNDGNSILTNNENQKKDRLSSAKTTSSKKKISHASSKIEDADAVNDKMSNNEIEDNSSIKSKDKKQTNAFSLMMDSRNKSIGSNSPGREKVDEEFEQQDKIDKKSIKAKRTLFLQKMADAKGALKNKEIQEYQEKCIKKKMDIRAERLKNMIKGNEPKPIVKNDNKARVETIAIVSINEDEDLPLSSHKNKLKLVNLFDDAIKSNNILHSKKDVVTKEEDEFLKKLSPSLKKKENMLCYFKKVEKEPDDIFSAQDLENDTAVIKVKFKSKSKNGIKKKKLSLNKVTEIQDENILLNKDLKVTEVAKKKKREKSPGIDEKVNLFKNDDAADPTEFDIMRPRRNVKRPAKYIDDMQLSSSDEDLHIITPKKKKIADQKSKCTPERNLTNGEIKPKKNQKLNEIKDVKILTAQKLNTEVIQPKKNTKLAPIFAVKRPLDAAAIEAKQKFLNSGVPDKLKRNMEKLTNKSVCVNHFHTVVHVQQKENTISDNIYLETIYDHQNDESDEESYEIVYKKGFFKQVINQDSQKEASGLTITRQKAQVILQNIKQLYPKFPVYRTYRLLKDKNRGDVKDFNYLDLDNSIEVINGMIDINNDSPDRLSWTDKYKAMSSKQIIGNFESIKELKKWLITWTENDCKLKKNNENSDSSDFYLSDTDSKDSMKCTNNLLVLIGPVGSGKTSLVYAVAAELAIKVLEVNASNKRTGKIMLQDLQEATQSHKVNRGKSSQDLSQKSQEIGITEKPKVYKKRGRPKKSIKDTKELDPLPKNEVLSQPVGSQDSGRTCMSLILIDDADIVFDQDDGFCAAIVQLVQSSKRPVILVTSSTTCPHLQRFLQYAKIIHTRPFFPRMLGTWLDIMCLADSGTCWPGLGAKCLDFYKGDIRKSINFLHFQTAKDIVTDNESTAQNIDDYRLNVEDENSNMSWTDRDGIDEKDENNETNSIWQNVMKKEANLVHLKHPINLFRVWWNIPKLLIPKANCEKQDKNSKGTKIHLDALSTVADMISIADCFSPSSNEMDAQLISVPWANFESYSVSEHECLDRYDKNNDIASQISHCLLTGSIMKAKADLDLESRIDLDFPEMATRRERDRIAERHSKISSFLSPSAVLDRRALALDYWSGCRSICRVERTKTDSNFKRNNRFCHYLKSANILCKSDSFDNLANSLYCKDE